MNKKIWKGTMKVRAPRMRMRIIQNSAERVRDEIRGMAKCGWTARDELNYAIDAKYLKGEENFRLVNESLTQARRLLMAQIAELDSLIEITELEMKEESK